MATQCVLIVGGRPQLVRKATELGLRVVLVQQPDEFQPGQAELVESALLVDYTDWFRLRPLAVAAHEVFGFCAAVSTTEPGLEPAGRLNDLLGLEEYVQGPEFSVESFSFDGQHVVVAITEKQTHTEFVELGHALPTRLDPKVEQRIVGCITEFLSAMGVRQGPGHTEVKLSPAGPRVIEWHNRTGGDRITELVDAAYGIDLEAHTVAWPSKVWPALTERPPAKAAAATRFLISSAGTVTQIQGVADVRTLDCVLDVDIALSVGDTVRPLWASGDRVGQVLVTGASTDAAVLAADQLVKKITIVAE